ncbi:MAG: type II secretion system protein [Candidatus Kappaea frigidicola]|nr:type II secretion system protein [Candidatus Kappaea frigidicola]
MKSKKGFTLVELMIVMVIIGILLSLLLPGVFTARQEALKTQVASNMRQIGIALYAHAKNNSGELPATLAALDPEYIEGMSDINTNIDGNAFTYEYEDASGNLYSLKASDVLVTDDDGDNATDYELRADGAVDTSP